MTTEISAAHQHRLYVSLVDGRPLLMQSCRSGVVAHLTTYLNFYIDFSVSIIHSASLP